jgi:hypothetical protein
VSMSSTHYYKILSDITIRKPKDLKDASREPAIRLHCTAADATWALQIRGVEQLATGQLGKAFVIATASLDRKTMIELRDAISTSLEDYAEFREPPTETP